MKHTEHPLAYIFEAIRNTQEEQRQRVYEEAVKKQKALLLERQKKDEALTQKIFFANELLKDHPKARCFKAD